MKTEHKQPVLQLTGIIKNYRLGAHLVAALQGIDLSVYRNEMLAITGPSGSGKSTILNLCGLIDRPDSGEILFNGRDINPLDEHQRTLLRREDLGFVFQGFNLIPVMTVAENVEYPLLLSGVAAAERKQRVAEQLAAVGLEKHAHHRPDALSGGQRQRVAIARALIKRPSLVIADEPTANLDSATADQVFELLQERAAQEGAAFIIATHDPRLSERCDRVVNMMDGKII